MVIEGKIKTLYSDETKSEAIFPRTKVSAISDSDGAGLDAILNQLSSDIEAKATESFVTNAIANAQLGGDNSDIDLSGYATKDDISALSNLVGDDKVSEQINSAINNIDYPVDSVNGKTGAVTLSASDVGAVPTSRTINSKALSSNVTLSASDVGALGTSGTQTLSGSLAINDTNNAGYNIGMTRKIDSTDYKVLMQPTASTANLYYYQGSTLANAMQLYADKTSFKQPVAITAGGTGAITAAAALTNLGLTATAAELNYCDGVTSAIQTQLNGKLSSFTLLASGKTLNSSNTSFTISNANNYKAFIFYGYTGTASSTTDTTKDGYSMCIVPAAMLTSTAQQFVLGHSIDTKIFSVKIASGTMTVGNIGYLEQGTKEGGFGVYGIK